MASPKKIPCKYGAKCYRKNADHIKNYSHPSKAKPDEQEEQPPSKKGRIDTFFAKTTDAEAKGSEKESARTLPVAQAEIEASDPSTPDLSDGEEEELPASPETMPDILMQKYGMTMPQDLFDLWRLCEEINPTAPRDALRSTLNVQLVGPFDVLAGRHRQATTRPKRNRFYLHWRYYYDPPEFMTLLRSTISPGLHWGYFRDDPEELPAFVASNDSSKDGVIKPCGPNLFAVLTDLTSKEIAAGGKAKEVIETLGKRLRYTAAKGDHSLELVTAGMKARDKKSVCKTLHKAGMVVPYDSKTELGYRPVPETPADIRKMLSRIVKAHAASVTGVAAEQEQLRSLEPLEELVTLCQFANDECDYGEGLELGLDLFSFTDSAACLRGPMLALLPIAYKLLHRNVYADIITAHLNSRSRSLAPDMFQ